MKIFKHISPAQLFWLIVAIIIFIDVDIKMINDYNFINNNPIIATLTLLILCIQAFLLIYIIITIILKFNKFLNTRFKYNKKEDNKYSIDRRSD